MRSCTVVQNARKAASCSTACAGNVPSARTPKKVAPSPNCRDGRLIAKDGPIRTILGYAQTTAENTRRSRAPIKGSASCPWRPKRSKPEIKSKSPKSEPLEINEIPIKELRQLALDIGNDRKNGMICSLSYLGILITRFGEGACSAASKLKDESIVAEIGPLYKRT